MVPGSNPGHRIFYLIVKEVDERVKRIHNKLLSLLTTTHTTANLVFNYFLPNPSKMTLLTSFFLSLKLIRDLT